MNSYVEFDDCEDSLYEVHKLTPTAYGLSSQLVSQNKSNSKETETEIKNFPKSFCLDLSNSTVYDQGGLGSSTACAIAAILNIANNQTHTLEPFYPKRLFVYEYNN